MAAIAHVEIEVSCSPEGGWLHLAQRVIGWAQTEKVELRDTIVLVPFAQLLPLARRAFAQLGGWMPRIETTRTLAQALGPPTQAGPGELALDVAMDGLAAAQLLRSQAWGAAWARRDPRSFERAVDGVVATAHALTRAAAAVPLPGRDEFWNQARAHLPPLFGPGSSERLLARVAVEWACMAPAPATDRLFMCRPAAWVAVQAGGPDALTQRLMHEAPADMACLLVNADPAQGSPFDGLAGEVCASFAVCDGFEHEAQCAAAQVIDHLRRGEVPVALVAQDRVLVRRVRALLERQHVAVRDETGWRLSTTRAAAQVMSLLACAAEHASTDTVLDWLKSGTRWPAVANTSGALASLEAACRKLHLWRAAALQGAPLDASAARLWQQANSVLSGLRVHRRRSLTAWLEALAGALRDAGAWPGLTADAAGRQVLSALQLETSQAVRDMAAPSLAATEPMTLDEFTAWVDGAFEQASFVTADADDGPGTVVIAPLARTMLRPFAAMVFPGADDKHLGSAPTADALIGDSVAEALGMPTMAQRRNAELFAFAHALAVPRITFLRRRLDGAEPLADSPLVERLALAMARAGRVMRVAQDMRIDITVAPTPVHRSAPSAPALLPAWLSASACEALRACPYRFYALRLLRLREDDELDGEIEKRDYGLWLHAVLHQFHASRERPGSAEVEVARLLAVAQEQQARQQLGDAEFLPFAASFATLAPRYVAWLHERDARGITWLRGEWETHVRPPQMEGVELRGRVDRVDHRHAQQGSGLEVLDYKTGSAEVLKRKVKQPLEDTQLAFYAALMSGQSDAPLLATYLALDGSSGIEEIAHKDVGRSAEVLVQGLAHDLSRLRAGAGLPALGEGTTCDHCEARGLCRRDHWAHPSPAGGGT